MPPRLLVAADPWESHHRRHIDLLAAAGVEMHLVDHTTNFQRDIAPVASHRPWPKSGRRTLSLLLGKRAGEAIAAWLEAVQLKSIWRREKAQVCHLHWVNGRIAGAANAGLRPLVVTAYGSDMNSTRNADYDPDKLVQVRAGLAQTDLFIADSADMVAIAEELAGRPLRSLLLPIGIDTDLFRPGYEAEAAALRAELDIPPGAKVVFSPRIMLPNYRQIELLRGFAASGLDGCMVFKAFLSDPDYVEAVRREAEALGIADRIRIVGEFPYERLPVLYAMADLAVGLPARDAFPVTFLEAAACELPMLTNHRPAYESNGMAPFLTFTADDPASVGEAMAWLCADPSARERAKAARAHVVENFNEAAFVRTLIDAYESLA